MIFMVKKQHLDSNKDLASTGFCFHFYNHLSCHHEAVFQYTNKLPTLAKKISQENKTGLARTNKWQLRKWLSNRTGSPPLAALDLW
jgi:hypothetical protein